MPTLYSVTGFDVQIALPDPTVFTYDIFLDGDLWATLGPGDSSSYSLTSVGTYTFVLVAGIVGDPVAFVVKNYSTGDTLGTFIFSDINSLVLIVGIDGRTNTAITITYPNETFIFPNELAEDLEWICEEITSGQGTTIEEVIDNLPSPKIIGNLTFCGGGYVGNDSLPTSCDVQVSNPRRFYIRRQSDQVLLYSRIECCCPVATGGSAPPVEPPTWVCTCQDWGKGTSYQETLFKNGVRLRNWALSGAGSIADCKHIMAAKRIEGIEMPIFTDPPFSGPSAPSAPGPAS